MSTIQDDQINDLMNSIQNKLSMLACEDSVNYFEAPSKVSSPKRDFLTATNEKKNKYKLSINELETSNRNDTQLDRTQLGESRIVARINDIQHFYMDKIQKMANEISNLEFDLQNLQKVNQQLTTQNKKLHKAILKNQSEQKQIIDKRMQQMRVQLISKFSKQAETHYEEHIKQMKSLNDEIFEQRGKKKYFEQEAALLRNQKNNLQQFYKSLLQSHKNMIRLDIQKSERRDISGSKPAQSLHQEVNMNYSTNRKAKKQRKDKKTEEMTKQEMIPFLAKGIQDLKDKLKIK